MEADTLKFGAQRVTLWGVEVPERQRPCKLNGEPWNCHEVAFRRLQLLATPILSAAASAPAESGATT